MTYFGSPLEDMETCLVAMSRWIDQSPKNAARDPEAQTWGRLAKVCEEAGEVIEKFIGYTEQNPRKGLTADKFDVMEELLDVALTALAAYEHMSNHQGQSMHDFKQHIAKRLRRVSLPVSQ